MKFLKQGFSREDLLRIDEKDLPVLADEVRAFIVDTVTKNGGHLGSSLGAVELTIAMLRKFNPLNDKIIFDVGHQSYPYKILTDRFDKFHTLRLKDGISGFPRRNESPYDHFNTGHSSTSISAALGYAKARDLLHEDRHVIAFIGDASLINGLALEALNYIHETNTKIIIILNDNRHSISNRVGGFSTVLAGLSANTFYRSIKNSIRKKAGVKYSPFFEKFRDIFKFIMKPSNIFDELDINYWGPFDGHDIKNAEKVLELAKNYYRPVLLHFNTIKGKGLPEAEENPTKYHQLSPMGTKKLRTWSEAASNIIEEFAEKDNRIICFTAAMITGVKLENFAKKFPERFFDVGIAEEHAVTLAAGMAAGGLKPVVAIYSTFIQRAYDQVLHDVCLQNLPVIFCLDRAGLENELVQMLFAAAEKNKPVAIRYPRGAGLNVAVDKVVKKLDWGKCEVVYKSLEPEIVIFAVGSMVKTSIDAAKILADKKIFAEVINARFIKPFDREFLKIKSQSVKLLVTAEEGILNGGFGAAVAEFLADENISVPVLRFGIQDRFIEHGSRGELLEICGLTSKQIAEKIAEKLSGKEDIKIYSRNINRT